MSEPTIAWPNPEQERKTFLANLLGRSESPTTADYANKPNLKAGSTGDAVTEVQTLLKRLAPSAGFALPDKFKVDGVYGPNTVQAVIHFQTAAKILKSGMTDGATWAALTKAVKKEQRQANGQEMAVAATDWLTTLLTTPANTPTVVETVEIAEAPEVEASWTPYIVGGVVLIGLIGGGLYLYNQQQD